MCAGSLSKEVFSRKNPFNQSLRRRRVLVVGFVCVRAAAAAFVLLLPHLLLDAVRGRSRHRCRREQLEVVVGHRGLPRGPGRGRGGGGHHGDGGGRRPAVGRGAAAASRTGAEPVGRATVLALVEVPLHVPPPAESLPARGTPVGAAVDVTVVLEGPGMLEELAALVAAVTAHRVGGHGECLADAIWNNKIESTIVPSPLLLFGLSPYRSGHRCSAPRRRPCARRC